MSQSLSRRGALQSLTAGLAAPASLAASLAPGLVQIATPYRPKSLSASHVVSRLVDHHAQFNNPSSNAGDINFGRVTSARAPWLIQLGLKLVW